MYVVTYCVFQCLDIVKDDFVVIWDLVKAEVVSITNLKFPNGKYYMYFRIQAKSVLS